MTSTAQGPGGPSGVESESVEPPSALEAVGTIPGQTVPERGSVWFLAFPYFKHPGGQRRLQFSAVGADASIATPAVSGRKVTIAGVAPGTTTVTVTARDPTGREASQQVNVTVERANRRPKATKRIPEQSVSVGDTVTVDLDSYFTDPDGDPLHYEVEVFFDKKAVVQMSGSAMAIIGLVEGSTSITITASDPDGENVQQRTRITVEPFNRPPEVVGTMPEQTVNVGETLSVDVNAFFGYPDRRVVHYEANSSSERAIVSMSGSVVAITGVTAGRTFIVVKLRDSGGQLAFPVKIVQPNRPPEPTGTISAQVVTAGRTLSMDMSDYFRDPDGDSLTYSAATDESVAAASMSGSDIAIREVAEGKAIVTVTARDPEGLSAEQSFAVTVWVKDGVTGTVTDCEVSANLLFVRTLRIAGKVRARRYVRDVKVHARARGADAGVASLGDLAAGEEKPFSTSQRTSLPTGRPSCSITVTWRDIPLDVPSDDT